MVKVFEITTFRSILQNRVAYINIFDFTISINRYHETSKEHER